MLLPPLLSPDQWTPAELDFARTVITGLSALVALSSALIAWSAQRAQRRHVRSERRFVAYRLVVLEPAKEALREFQATALSSLSKGRIQLREFTTNDVQISVLDSCRRSIVDEFNVSYYKASGELLDAANAWGDARLTDALTNLVTDLQDDVVDSCRSMQNEDSPQPPVDLVLRGYVSKLLSTLVHYEVDTPPRRLAAAAKIAWRKVRRRSA